MMRAAVLRGGALEVRETPDPVPAAGQILVRTRACGICASDIHFMDHPGADADDDTGLSDHDPDRDIVMGHEYCAEIVDYGPGTRRAWATGTRVSSIPVLLGAHGMRVIGQSPEAPGGFGEYFLLTEAMTQPVPTELPDELVSIADAISVGWSYVQRAAVQPREVPLVIGCGAIGLSAVASMKRLGIGPIVAVDFVESRRATALAMGADVVVDPADVSPYNAWRELAYGSPEPVRDIMRLLDVPGCVVFECVGVPGVLDSIVRGCERGTRVFSAGGPPEGRPPPHHDRETQGPEHPVRRRSVDDALERSFRGGVRGASRRDADVRVHGRPRRRARRDRRRPGRARPRAHHRGAVVSGLQIGMIGVGNMGMPVARRLRAAGYDVRVYARRPEVAAEAESIGAVAAPSIADLGAISDVVIVNVFSDDQVREVALGPDGAVAHMRAGSTLVNHATGRPSTIREVADAGVARGVRTLDCAMSGGPFDIDAGQLTLLVGGDVVVLEEMRPVLASYSDPIIPVGAIGDGQKVKLLNNALFGAHVALALQIERTARQLDMEPSLVLPAIQACSGNSYALSTAAAMGSAEGLVEAARKYIEKDVAVCVEVAGELGADLGSVLTTAREIYA
jgi:3-hydroxyisobutyrate dehydrogenase-like beta-hydroxyacid dehydrogenase/threonine dehydrogenase-like Zn-dependent dehydrogenase